MPSSASRLRVLSWTSTGILLAMIGPDFAGHDYPLPYRRYIKLGLFLGIVAINVYLMVQARRIRREKTPRGTRGVSTTPGLTDAVMTQSLHREAP